MTSFAERSYTWPKWLPKMKALLHVPLSSPERELTPYNGLYGENTPGFRYMSMNEFRDFTS